MSAGTKRTALKVITLILLGLGIALVVRGLAERVESGAGLARLNSSERCDAAPGCNQAMVRVVYPGAGVIVLASWTAKRIGWRPFWARGRPGAVGGVKHLIRHRSTLTLHRSTRDGPVREGTPDNESRRW